MRRNDEYREEPRVSDAPKDLAEVQRRLDEIQSRKRGETRWTISRHTAEMAMEAIAEPRPSSVAKSNGKSRRRTRRTRML
jgi:hypothetical protein